MKLTLALLLGGIGAVAQAGLVASYDFQGNFDSAVGSAPSLSHTGTGSFQTATLFGQTRQTYKLGTSTDSGFFLDNSSLGLTNNYSFEIVINAGAASGYGKILDTAGRTSDAGLYINPSNGLTIYPTGVGGSVPAAEFVHIVITQNGNIATGYVSGVEVFQVSTPILIASPATPIALFLDDLATSGNEHRPFDVALVNFYDSVLSGAEVQARFNDPFAPVPEPFTMIGLAALGLGAIARRRKSTR